MQYKNGNIYEDYYSWILILNSIEDNSFDSFVLQKKTNVCSYEETRKSYIELQFKLVTGEREQRMQYFFMTKFWNNNIKYISEYKI